ncbi:MAG: rhodanese-like domain-containing protein [Cyanobacteria bacterium K_Offshore_surface_m2_239]|nr:rhodanese-like domain-containing protein [Cyanobacteria bacterium K_Offshore_surface_m2_239]
MKLPHPHKIAEALPGNLRSGKPRQETPPEPWAPLSRSYAGLPELPPSWVAEHREALTLLDVRSAEEYNGPDGHVAGSLNVPLSRLQQADLPSGPLVLVCQSGNRSAKGVQTLLERGVAHPVSDLRGGLPSWQQAGLPVRKLKNAPLPLMRQVQIAAGSLVLLGLILSNTVAPAWILLCWFVGAGLVFAGISGFCGMARLLALMPWNKVSL